MAEDDRMVDVLDPVDESESNGTSAHGANAGYESATSNDEDAPLGNLLMLPFTEARARALEDFDRKFLSAALARHNGNIARTARALGLHRQSLQKLMARRGIKSVRLPASPGTAAQSG